MHAVFFIKSYWNVKIRKVAEKPLVDMEMDQMFLWIFMVKGRLLFLNCDRWV